MVGNYKVITLCGSTRFKDAFMEAQKRLTLEGNIVINVDGYIGSSTKSEIEYAKATGNLFDIWSLCSLKEGSAEMIIVRRET